MRPLNQVSQIICLFFFAALVGISCRKKKPEPPPPVIPPSSNKLITQFEFRQSDNATVAADIGGVIGIDSIKFVLPAETDVTNLKPFINYVGKSISPSADIARNFSSPLTYTVKAEDGSEKNYIVVISYRKTVFVTGWDDYVYALDGNGGDVIWKTQAKCGNTSTVAVANGMVYTLGTDGIYALDAKTGAQKWKLTLPTNVTSYEMLPAPLVINNVVYMAAWDGFVYALNPATGSLIWKTPSPTGKSFFANVTLKGNTLLAGSFDSTLYALDITNGAIKWSFNCHGPIYKNPLVVNNTVYAGGLTGHFYAINISDGALRWDSPNGYAMSSPVYSNGRIYCGGGTESWALDTTTGNILWTIRINPGGFSYVERSGPVIDNGVLYAGSIAKKVYAWDIATKAMIWSAPAVESIYASPVLVDGILYIADTGGRFYALSAATGIEIWKSYIGNRGSACVVDTKGNRYYATVSGYNN